MIKLVSPNNQEIYGRLRTRIREVGDVALAAAKGSGRGRHIRGLVKQLDREVRRALSKAQDQVVIEVPSHGSTLKDKRRTLVEAYIAEVLDITGKRLSKKDIWKAAGYTDATEFERWQRGDPRTTNAVCRNIERVITQKPHWKI